MWELWADLWPGRFKRHTGCYEKAMYSLTFAWNRSMTILTFSPLGYTDYSVSGVSDVLNGEQEGTVVVYRVHCFTVCHVNIIFSTYSLRLFRWILGRPWPSTLFQIVAYSPPIIMFGFIVSVVERKELGYTIRIIDNLEVKLLDCTMV
jgi:hypothetical protein